MYIDGDDDNGNTDTCRPEEGEYNIGDEIGERVGEGHDPVEDTLS